MPGQSYRWPGIVCFHGWDYRIPFHVGSELLPPELTTSAETDADGV
jgi:hypothetical protein